MTSISLNKNSEPQWHRDILSKIADMNVRIVLSLVSFWTETLMWKSGENEAEHSTWMLMLTERPFTDGGAASRRLLKTFLFVWY